MAKVIDLHTGANIVRCFYETEKNYIQTAAGYGNKVENR